MTIYHYTRAPTLRLILENRTIRFTRADCLNDKSEVPFKSALVDPRYFFVSSWTTREREQWAQWEVHGDRWRGIRIGFANSPFPREKVMLSLSRMLSSGKKLGLNVPQPVDVPFTGDSLFGNGYLLMPDPTMTFGDSVHYVADPAAAANALIVQHSDGMTISGGPTILARLKGDGWDDQQEFRFALFATKAPAMDYRADPAAYKEAYLDQLQAKHDAGLSNLATYPDVHFLDLPLRDDAFNDMTVMLGAEISDADREDVAEAISRYAPGAVVSDSRMTPRS